MDIISFIKKHRLYKYVKENNGLIIFLLTIFGTIFTLIVRGLSYVYYLGRYRALKIPKIMIMEEAHSINIGISIISIILMIFSIVISSIFLFIYFEVKTYFKENKNKKKNPNTLLDIFQLPLLCLVFTSAVNYAIILLQGIEINGKAKLFILVIIDLFELLFTYVYYKTIIYDSKDVKAKGIKLIVIIMFSVALLITALYQSGFRSVVNSNEYYPITVIDSYKYVIVERYNDNCIVEKCEEISEEKENTTVKKLIIYTDKQKAINLENVEYENKKFNAIVLEGNK